MAKSRSIGGIYASLTLRDGGFRTGLKNASKALGTFAVAGIGAAVVGVGALSTALAAGSKNTMEMAGTLDDLSATTGLTIANAMKMRKAFELGGLEAAAAGASIGKMQKAIVTAAKGGDDPFKEIGISAKELVKLSPETQFERIGDAIMRIENPAERTAKAMAIFGKSGAGLTNVFGQFKDAEQFLGKMPDVFQQYAKAMARADDIINELPNKSQQFFTGFTAGIIGEVLPQLEKINGHDFTSVGQDLARSLAKGLYFIQDPQTWSGIGDIAFASFVILGERIGNEFAAVFNAIGDVAKASFEKKFSHFGDFIGDMLYASSPNAETREKWRDYKNEQILKRNGKAGFSPLGGGAPAGEEVSFLDSYQKYRGLLKEDSAEAQKLWKEGAEKIAGALAKATVTVERNAADAAAISTPGKIDDPIKGLSEEIIKSVSSARMEVNEYQRRGLSLGSGSVEVKQDRQITLLSSIDGSLKKLTGKTPGTVF